MISFDNKAEEIREASNRPLRAYRAAVNELKADIEDLASNEALIELMQLRSEVLEGSSEMCIVSGKGKAPPYIHVSLDESGSIDVKFLMGSSDPYELNVQQFVDIALSLHQPDNFPDVFIDQISTVERLRAYITKSLEEFAQATLENAKTSKEACSA